MSWFLIALIGPVLYAAANHTDKYIISKHLKGGEVGSLIIFSTLFTIITLPVILLLHPEVLDIAARSAGILAANDVLTVIAVLLYFYALHYDEATYVVPFYQTIPIFAFALAYFILGETISYGQAGAAVLILAGALILSFEAHEGGFRFKRNVVLLMLGASILYAVNGVIFKLMAVDEGYWPSTFWGLIGKVATGFAFLAFVPSYRNQFVAMIKTNRSPILGLNALSESLFIAAELITQYAFLLAPVALVLLVNSFQPLFVLVLGVVLTLLFPKIGLESLTKHKIMQKLAGIVLIGIGTYYVGA